MVGKNKNSVFSQMEQQKALRAKGKAYKGVKRKKNEKPVAVERPAKKFKGSCENSCSDENCKKVSQQRRMNIFNYFWKLESWSAKKAFVRASVSKTKPERRTEGIDPENARKKYSYNYYLFDDNGDKVKVCQIFFLDTLAIGKKALYNWMKDAVTEDVRECKINQNNENRIEDIDNKAGEVNGENKNQPMVINGKSDSVTELDPEKEREESVLGDEKGNKNIEVAIEEKSGLAEISENVEKLDSKVKKVKKSDSVHRWLDIIPKVPSHYCRASSKRIYLESTFNSKKHIHGVYVQWCKDNNLKFVARKKFNSILKEKKISIHHPRKDQCDTCVSYKEGNLSLQDYQEHRSKKEEARVAKNLAIASSSKEVCVTTMDVQSVLLCPKLLVSAAYYSCKLQIHNFTIYNNYNRNVDLYVWDESQGGVTANEFVSCLISYIESQSPEIKKNILISDGCGYQNRNRVLSSSLSDLAVKKKIEIEQLILEKGHTMMEVDSVHSTLEPLLKAPVYSFTEYIKKMGEARPGQPYKINALKHDFFKNFEKLDSCLASIRPGKKKGDPVVTDIRALKYSPDGSISYKLRHTDAWKVLINKRKLNTEIPEQLHPESLRIKKSKYDDLQTLKEFIPKEHHSYYDNLRY